MNYEISTFNPPHRGKINRELLAAIHSDQVIGQILVIGGYGAGAGADGLAGTPWVLQRRKASSSRVNGAGRNLRRLSRRAMASARSHGCTCHSSRVGRVTTTASSGTGFWAGGGAIPRDWGVFHQSTSPLIRSVRK
jgi:hypothetical protein